MTDIAIRVENLSKRYRIGGKQEAYKTLREAIVDTVISPLRRLRNPQSAIRNPETIWALKDVSFEVQRGEVVGTPSKDSGQALAETARGRQRCSRSSPASWSRGRDMRRSTAGWVPCWRHALSEAEGWAPAFIRS